MVCDGPATPAAHEDSAHHRVPAAHLLHGRRGQRGRVRGHRAAPRHAHGHELLPVQFGAERLAASIVW